MLRWGFDVLVIDPWNKLDMGAGVDTFRAERQALNRAKAYAKRRNVIVVVVTHPNRAVKDRDGSNRKPTMYDMSGGNHWEAMSDHSVGVYRKDLDVPTVEISVEKAKFAGSGFRRTATVVYQRNIEYFVPATNEAVNVAADGDCQGLVDVPADAETIQ